MRGLFSLSSQYANLEDFGHLRKTSDFFGILRNSSGIFGNDRVVFKNPSTPRINISRLYLRKSWQVYNGPNLKFPTTVPFTGSPDVMCVFRRLSKDLTSSGGFKSSFTSACTIPGGGGVTLGISGWRCAAGTLEPLAYTRASFSWILLPYTRVNSPIHSYPIVAIFQKLKSLAQSKAKPKQNLIPQSLLS